MKLSTEHNKKFLGISEGAINELQPIVEKTGSDIMDFAKEVVMSEISNLFTKGRDKINEKKGKING